MLCGYTCGVPRITLLSAEVVQIEDSEALPPSTPSTVRVVDSRRDCSSTLDREGGLAIAQPVSFTVPVSDQAPPLFSLLTIVCKRQRMQGNLICLASVLVEAGEVQRSGRKGTSEFETSAGKLGNGYLRGGLSSTAHSMASCL